MSATNEPEAPPLRSEKALLITNVAVGGRLTLNPGYLSWQSSGWNWSKGILAECPKALELELSRAQVKAGGRHLPRFELLSSLLAPYFFLVELLFYLRRKTIEVSHPSLGVFYFSVRDVDSWVQDVNRVKGNAPPERPPLTVEQAERELKTQGR